MSTTEYKKAFEYIKKANTIAIAGHIRPDGDCIGSALALNSVLVGMEKSVSIFFDGETPQQFDYLDGFEKIQNAVPADTEFDLLIIVDLNSADRLGTSEILLKRCRNIIVIDHHIGFNMTVDVAITKSNYGSRGEVIYELFAANKIDITKSIANALYTAVSTDTGCFLYPSTSANTHVIAAELLRAGCDFEKINYINFRVFDMVLVRGMKEILRNLKFKKGGQIAYTRLRNGDIYGATERHKLKQYIGDVKGVRVSILITQESRRYFHVSMRSHGDANVETVAKYFGGGGHKNASGFTIHGQYKSVAKRIVAKVEALCLKS